MFTQYKVFWYYYCSLGVFILIILLILNYFLSKKGNKTLNFDTDQLVQQTEDIKESDKKKLEESNEKLEEMISFNIFTNALLLSLIFFPILFSFHDQIIKFYKIINHCSYLYLEFVFRPTAFTKCVSLLSYR